MRIVGPVPQLVGVDASEHVGGAQGLPDITLALRLAHVQDVVAHPVGGRRHLLAAVGLHGECHRNLLTRRLAWMSDSGARSAAASSANSRSRGPQVSRVTSAATRPIAA